MRVYWRNNVKDLSLLYRDYFVFGDLQGMLFRHKTLHLTAELNRQRKYKRKSTTIGSRNIRLISREIDISQIKTNL